MERVVHPIEPVYDSSSVILILGSFPSVKSREQGFYYGHPQNRFWRMLSAVLDEKMPESIQDKKKMLLDNGIALWDVIASCEIEGSSDSSIRNAVPNDISVILKTADIKCIICNGAKSFALYRKYIEPFTGIEAVRLSSTSPANAAASLEKLTEEWRKVIGEVLQLQCIK